MAASEVLGVAQHRGRQAFWAPAHACCKAPCGVVAASGCAATQQRQSVSHTYGSGCHGSQGLHTGSASALSVLTLIIIPPSVNLMLKAGTGLGVLHGNLAEDLYFQSHMDCCRKEYMIAMCTRLILNAEPCLASDCIAKGFWLQKWQLSWNYITTPNSAQPRTLPLNVRIRSQLVAIMMTICVWNSFSSLYAYQSFHTSPDIRMLRS